MFSKPACTRFFKNFGPVLLFILSGFFGADAQPKVPLTETELQAEIYFGDGCKYNMLDQYEKAVGFFLRAMELTPNNAAIHFKLAEVQFKLNRLTEAADEARKAVELDGKQPYYYQLLASILEQRKDYKEAAKVYQKMIEKLPNPDQYYVPLAGCYLQMEKYSDAIKALNKLEKKTGKNEETGRQKQQIYLRMNKLDKAIAEGRELIAANPDEPLYSISLAELLFSNNRTDEAIKELNGILEKHPDIGYGHLLLYEIYKSQGKTEMSGKERELAFKNPEVNIDEKIKILVAYNQGFANEKEQETALHLSSVVVDVHPDDPKSFAMNGDLLAIAGKKKEARQAYLKAATFPGITHAVWEQILKLDLELNDEDSIGKHTDKAVELFPNNAVFWFYNGRHALIKKDYKKAVTSLEQGKKFSSENQMMQLEITAMLGDSYYSLKDYKKSDGAYDAALKIDPKNDHILNNYSYYLSLRKDKLELARRMSTQLIEQNPDQANYLDTHAWVLYALKEYKQALVFLEKAAANSNSGTIHEHLGDVYFKLGEKEKAFASWKKAKELGSDDNPELLEKKINTKMLIE